MTLLARAATPADHDAFLALAPELATGDPLPDRDRWLETIAPGTIFFEDAGQIVAYAWATPLADVGYVRHVVVHPAHRGKGHGRAVMAEIAARLRQAGCSRWTLNVKPDNAPAIRLYRAVGMTEQYESAAVRLEWDVVSRLPPPARPVTARLLDPADDATLETAFRLPRGTLTGSRKFPDRVVLRLVDPAAPDELRVGVASFDPHFPGSFPFRVADPTFARVLVEAMRPHALPKFSHVGAVVEDDPALERLLVAHGAVVRLRIVHYEGAL